MLQRRKLFLLSLSAALMPRASAAASLDDLLVQLLAGGCNLYFRHSLTVRAGQADDDLTSCVSQRNLTEDGVALARRIGQRIGELRVPIGEVLASPYCRCVDTARWAFGRVAVVDWLQTDGNPQGAPERARLSRLEAVLAAPPPAGQNAVYVAHGNNLAGLTQMRRWPPLPIEEAEAVIFRPNGSSIPEVIGRVRALDWSNAVPG